jgi:hypothetical protein
MSTIIQNQAPTSLWNLPPSTSSELAASDAVALPLRASKQTPLPQAMSKAKENIILSLAEVIMKLAEHLEAQLKRIGDEQESRILTLDDLGDLERALVDIKDAGEPPYSAETFDVPVKLEYQSPAKGKNLWPALVYYGIQKDGDTPPKTKQELDKLIDKLKTKMSSISTINNETITRMSQIQGNRDNYVSQSLEFTMQELKMMRSILNAR